MKTVIPGISFILIVAIISHILGAFFPLIGGPVFGILLGMLIKVVWQGNPSLNAGVNYSSKKILQYAIIAMGAGISLASVYEVGVVSFKIMSFTIITAFLVAYSVGKLFKLPFKLTTLIAMGTAICGGSAIAAITPVIDAKDDEIAYGISTIFLFNIIAALVFPVLGHYLGMSDSQFGLFAGTAINDTSSVVAASYTFSEAAGSYATIVKLTRTTMIIPITLIYAIAFTYYKKKYATQVSVDYSFKKIFPWFILGFLGFSLLNTLSIITPEMGKALSKIGKFMIVMAMSAIGFKTNYKQIIGTGYKPLLLGAITWITVIGVSLFMV